MKLRTGIIFLLLFPQILSAALVSREQAYVVAQHFLMANDVHAVEFTLNDAFPGQENKALQSGFYVFNISAGGFIIISSDDAAYPVLGYSTEGSFGQETMPPAFAGMLEGFTEQISIIKSTGMQANSETAMAWKMLSEGQSYKTKSTSVAPLLHCLWDQGGPYNALCPQDPAGPGGRVYAGCVATAMAMNMYYFRYPEQPQGTHGYQSAYGNLYVDYSQSHYNYEQMPYQLTYYNYDGAKIQYDCGVAVDMMYSPNGSGAYMDDALNAMKEHFGYNPSATLEYKDNYTEQNWKTLLKSQLDLGYPLIYAGYDTDAGHAFVCDGYDSNDMFHFNWGWSGSYNGYYYIFNLNPGYNFSIGQQAFINCYPASVSFPQACGNYTMTSRSGSMVAGSGPSGYLNNQQCSWLIAPIDSVSYIKISFRYFSTESAQDVLTIYSGTDASAPVAGTYSGSTLPSELTIQGNHAYITFSSNSSVTDKGFHADYYGNVPQYCTILQVLSDSAGTVYDGSGQYQYANNATCRWKIMPEGAAGILFEFSDFSLEDGMDFLHFFEYPSEIQVASFTGNMLPQSLYIASEQVMVLFRSDESNPDAGFRFNYRGLATGDAEWDDLSLFVYSNAIHNPVVSMQGFPQGTSLITVHDLAGRKMFETEVKQNGTPLEIEIPLQHSNSGMYLIDVRHESFYRVMKFSK